MIAQTINGSQIQPSISSPTLSKYALAYEEDVRLQSEATGWDDYSAYQHPSRIALELVETGETAWHLPYFYGHVHDFMHDLYLSGRYEVAAFVAEFLLDTLPEDPLDDEVVNLLLSIRGYSYCLCRRVAQSCWPRSKEYYLRESITSSSTACRQAMRKMIPYAENAAIERAAEMRTNAALIRSGRKAEVTGKVLATLN